MKVSYSKYYNEDKNRLEFVLVNFQYCDGNDLVGQLFQKEFDFKTCYTFDGIWYRVIRICLDKCEYELLWHEDIGNCIYCQEQSTQASELLEERLKIVLEDINMRLNQTF